MPEALCDGIIGTGMMGCEHTLTLNLMELFWEPYASPLRWRVSTHARKTQILVLLRLLNVISDELWWCSHPACTVQAGSLYHCFCGNGHCRITALAEN